LLLAPQRLQLSSCTDSVTTASELRLQFGSSKSLISFSRNKLRTTSAAVSRLLGTEFRHIVLYLDCLALSFDIYLDILYLDILCFV
ncbi:hypothetical protein M758_UG134500, partial [Ceratodon purpureus]